MDISTYMYDNWTIKVVFHCRRSIITFDGLPILLLVQLCMGWGVQTTEVRKSLYVLLSNSQAGQGRHFSQPRAHLLVERSALYYHLKTRPDELVSALIKWPRCSQQPLHHFCPFYYNLWDDSLIPSPPEAPFRGSVGVAASWDGSGRSGSRVYSLCYWVHAEEIAWRRLPHKKPASFQSVSQAGGPFCLERSCALRGMGCAHARSISIPVCRPDMGRAPEAEL